MKSLTLPTRRKYAPRPSDAELEALNDRDANLYHRRLRWLVGDYALDLQNRVLVDDFVGASDLFGDLMAKAMERVRRERGL